MDSIAVLDEDRSGRQCPPPKSFSGFPGQSGCEVGEGVSMEDILGETAWISPVTELHFLKDVGPFLYPHNARIVDGRKSEFSVRRQDEEVDEDVPDPTVELQLRKVTSIALAIILASHLDVAGRNSFIVHRHRS